MVSADANLDFSDLCVLTPKVNPRLFCDVIDF